jgi:hypothetical protein
MKSKKEMIYTPIFEPKRYIQPNFFFYQTFGCMPNKLNYVCVNHQKLFDKLMLEFKIDKSKINIVKSFEFDHNKFKNVNPIENKTLLVFKFEERKYKLQSCMVEISHELMLFFNPGLDSTEQIELLFSPNVSIELIEKLEKLIISCIQISVEPNSIYLVSKENGYLSLVALDIKKTNVSIANHYNDDFADVSNIIINRLNTDNDKGLVLLHGLPGTGKTSYIRYLTNSINKKLIFLPPDLVCEISSPNFLSFIIEHPNSILIIEDAENIIEERIGGGSAVMSNLLNLTDGLLSDCLKLQVVCSFNTQLGKIDKALLRKGRLIARYEFQALEKSKAQRLSDTLGFDSLISEDMTLAQIFNQDQNSYDEKRYTKIGFN